MNWSVNAACHLDGRLAESVKDLLERCSIHTPRIEELDQRVVCCTVRIAYLVFKRDKHGRHARNEVWRRQLQQAVVRVDGVQGLAYLGILSDACKNAWAISMSQRVSER